MSGVLVVMEQREGTWNKMSFEALAAGQQLAAMQGTTCSAAVIGAGISSLTTELATKKLANVYSVQHDLLTEYTADGYVIALEQAIKQAGAEYVRREHTLDQCVRRFCDALRGSRVEDSERHARPESEVENEPR